ncbi:MFS transporter [Agromyces kandeliae]|uniref:MFS transporter n=1 Tax=Agromyces kandeliae TaxID=2666141 RepID=A0A6L5R0X7_9MICO|nr:MFS transporter [Agromyces kandeliae]MRX43643.1 MFS transporter [Agromyces kandeliae]
MTDQPQSPEPPHPTRPGAVTPPLSTAELRAVTGLELQGERVVPKRQVWSWALWDWATQPFNSVILTFVFTALYLTSDWFLDPAVAALGEDDPAYERGLADLASGLGWAITIAGILIAVLAPVLGQRADVAGRRKLWLGGATAALVACMFGLFFVQGTASYFVLGVSLIAAGTVFGEIAGVNYNAMLVQVSTPKTVGKVSGLGWGLGYLGGIVALVLVVVATAFDWWGMPTDDGLVYRVIAVGCAVWTLVFAWPVLVYVPEAPPAPGRARVGFFRSYGVLVQDIVRLWRESRPTFWFLLASAVFRDGLAGVFAFGAVIAAVAFRFTSNEVMIFGIAANLLAGVSTIVAGRFDDRFGPRAVILTALGGLVGAGLIVFFLHDAGKLPFWIFGLILTLFVGPAQAASRSFLARVTPAGRESEIFGLYATTGRAASFLSPMLWSAFIVIFGATYWGVLGIVLVLAAGLVLMLFVRVPQRADAAASGPTSGA